MEVEEQEKELEKECRKMRMARKFGNKRLMAEMQPVIETLEAELDNHETYN